MSNEAFFIGQMSALAYAGEGKIAGKKWLCSMRSQIASLKKERQQKYIELLDDTCGHRAEIETELKRVPNPGVCSCGYHEGYERRPVAPEVG